VESLGAYLVDGLEGLVGSDSRVEQQRLAVLGALGLEIELVGRLFGDLRQLLLQSCRHGADCCRLKKANCLGQSSSLTIVLGGLEMEMAATEILSCVSPSSTVPAAFKKFQLLPKTRCSWRWNRQVCRRRSAAPPCITHLFRTPTFT